VDIAVLIGDVYIRVQPNCSKRNKYKLGEKDNNISYLDDLSFEEDNGPTTP
jgi:hypothetical protein